MKNIVPANWTLLLLSGRMKSILPLGEDLDHAFMPNEINLYRGHFEDERPRSKVGLFANKKVYFEDPK